MFKDTSIFQGITQYKDENGTEWKREDNEATYKFYKLSCGSWHYQGSIVTSKGGIALIHSKFLKSME